MNVASKRLSQGEAVDADTRLRGFRLQPELRRRIGWDQTSRDASKEQHCRIIHKGMPECCFFRESRCKKDNCIYRHLFKNPEAPDCSFFLEGHCKKDNCPYRQVFVNPETPYCDGILQGYSKNTEKCKEKHTYDSTVYVEMGVCPDRECCKFYHPNRKGKLNAQLKGQEKGTKYKQIVKSYHFMRKQQLGARVNGHKTSTIHNRIDRNVSICMDTIKVSICNNAVKDNKLIANNLALLQAEELPRVPQEQHVLRSLPQKATAAVATRRSQLSSSRPTGARKLHISTSALATPDNNGDAFRASSAFGEVSQSAQNTAYVERGDQVSAPGVATLLSAKNMKAVAAISEQAKTLARKFPMTKLLFKSDGALVSSLLPVSSPSISYSNNELSMSQYSQSVMMKIPSQVLLQASGAQLMSKILGQVQPVYKRSANGFSLSLSGVTLLGGGHLNSTKALAESTSEVVTKAKAADADTSSPTKPAKISLMTPRGSIIGGTSYLRVGKGNQLIRDPMASSRAVAAERFRWKLHNARSRGAKKQIYCQSFTKLGKCNKENRYCPYIHDREQEMVCTKFLKGNCMDDQCLLTHKVVPQQMPDCYFFLEGLCINESCPYRHVSTNPKATYCDEFLKGYCRDGDKCNKKHTFVCSDYEQTGECPDLETCKFHHSKKKHRCPAMLEDHSIGTKRKWRYFSTVEPPSVRQRSDSTSNEESSNDESSIDVKKDDNLGGGSMDFISL